MAKTVANVFNSHTFLFYRVARHRREVVEPEIIQEKSDSEDERHRKRFGEEEESSEEEEELDEEVIIPSSYQKKKDMINVMISTWSKINFHYIECLKFLFVL